jgi:hypothetical protein
MKWAAQAITFVSAVGQVGAAVGAVSVEQAKFTLSIFEQDQILTQQANGFDRADGHGRVKFGIEFIHQSNGVPIMT